MFGAESSFRRVSVRFLGSGNTGSSKFELSKMAVLVLSRGLKRKFMSKSATISFW